MRGGAAARSHPSALRQGAAVPTGFGHVWRSVHALGRLRGRFPWLSMVSRRRPLEGAGEALADVEARRAVKAIIVP